MFDSIFDEMFGNDGGGDIWNTGGFEGGQFNLFGGNEDAAGITGFMGMPGGSYGDYGGGNVFDGGFPTSMDLYNPMETAFGGLGYDQPGSDWASGGGGDWMSRIGRMLTGQNLGTAARIAGSALGIGSGVRALGQAQDLQQQAAAADPMAPYRTGWAQRLNELLANPGSITSDPGYDAAMEAVKRGGAAAGNFAGGGMVGGLAQFGVDFYDRAVRRLSGLVGGSPGAGLPAQQSSINLGNAGINRIQSGIASMASGLLGEE
jgi:hypothetical protein